MRKEINRQRWTLFSRPFFCQFFRHLSFSITRVFLSGHDQCHFCRLIFSLLLKFFFSSTPLGDGLSEERAAQLKHNERTDLQRLEKTRPTLELALTADPDPDHPFILPQKPVSPPRSRREKFELYQAMSWQSDITPTDEMDQSTNQRSHTPVSYHEIEYEPMGARRRPVDEPPPPPPNVREETRVAELRSVSAPAAPAVVKPVPIRVEVPPRMPYPEREPPRQTTAANQHPGLHASMLSSSTYSNTEHQSHTSYRSIFNKCKSQG